MTDIARAWAVAAEEAEDVESRRRRRRSRSGKFFEQYFGEFYTMAYLYLDTMFGYLFWEKEVSY